MSALSSIQSLSSSDLQSEVISALQDFYAFLTKLPWLDPSDVLEPPEQGWPNINSDNFAPFHKTNTVIELLKHIPYIRMDGPNKEYALAWSTHPCDYRRKFFQNVHPEINCWEIPDTTERNFSFPEWVVPITYGKVNGQYIMLDTVDGTAMRYEASWLRDPVFEANDPRAWRNECANPGSTARLSDILNEWKGDFTHLHVIGQPSINGPQLHFDSEREEYKELQEVMINHGWPDNFDRKGCRTAMLEWEEQRTQKLIDAMQDS